MLYPVASAELAEQGGSSLSQIVNHLLHEGLVGLQAELAATASAAEELLNSVYQLQQRVEGELTAEHDAKAAQAAHIKCVLGRFNVEVVAPLDTLDDAAMEEAPCQALEFPAAQC